MNILVFSKDDSICDYLEQHFQSPILLDSHAVKYCSSFTELGQVLPDPHDLLIFHLSAGDDEEKICYEFVSLYKRAFKMLVLTNLPNSEQGMRIFRAGIRGYSNTYLKAEKLSIAIDVICQGKVWMGAEVLEKIMECRHLVESQNITATQKETATKTSGFWSKVVDGVKKIFS